MEDFLATVLPRTADTGDIPGQLPQIFFLSFQILLYLEKCVLNI